MTVQHWKRWGQWRYNKDTLGLEYIDYKPGKQGQVEYEVDLERCCTASGILDWILQLAGKNWIRPQDIGHFVLALEELAGWGLQGKVIGEGQTFDWKAHLLGASNYDTTRKEPYAHNRGPGGKVERPGPPG